MQPGNSLRLSRYDWRNQANDGRAGASAPHGRLQSGTEAARLQCTGDDLLRHVYARSTRRSVLNKGQVLKDLREQGLTFHSIDLKDASVRVLGSTAILTAESRTVSSRSGRNRRRTFASSPYTHKSPTLFGLSTFRAPCCVKKEIPIQPRDNS